MKKRLTSATSQRRRTIERRIKKPEYLTVESMSKLMFSVGGIHLQVGPFTENRCTQVLKALTVFVARNPPSVAVNLFKADQISKVNPYQVLSCDNQTRSTRNWQYVFAIINQYFTEPSHITGSQYLPIVSQKSYAVIVGEIMANFEVDEPEGKIAVIIGYWIAKLYSVSIYRAYPMDLPEPIKKTYRMFLEWRGPQWGTKDPNLIFQDDTVWTKEEIMSCFPFAHECVPSTSSPTIDIPPAEVLGPVGEYVFTLICNALGEDKLQRYIWAFPGSLIDFFLSQMGMKYEGISISTKISEIMEYWANKIDFKDEFMGSNEPKKEGTTATETNAQKKKLQKKEPNCPTIPETYKSTTKKDYEWKLPCRKL